MATRFIIEGITDERDSCDCCGKTNLKRTVVLQDTENDGEFVFFGTTCAARAMKIPVKEVKAGVKSKEDAKRASERAARRERDRIEMAEWSAFLVEQTGGIFDFRGDPCIFSMIQALGGFQAARTLQRASVA